jgi:glycosyltransferase involved in cell wall biosynthesis
MRRKCSFWFVSQYAGGPGVGMQYRQFQLAKELNLQGHQSIVISGSFSHLYRNPPLIKRNGERNTLDGVNYVWVKNPVYQKSISIGRFWNMLVFAYNILRLDVRSLPIPDAVVISSPSMLPIVAALKWKRRFKCKVFFEVRDIWPLTLQELGNLSRYHPLVMFMRYFECLAYRKSDLVVSLLPNASKHYEEGGMPAKNFRYLPNGVESDISEVQETSNWPDSIADTDFVVGYGGSIGKANALRYLIDAAHLLKDEKSIHFVCVGKGDQLESLKEQASGLSNVHFIPPVEKREFLSMLKKFTLCYIGLERESLFRFGVSPNKLFDYMLAKRPVLYAIDSGNKPVDEAKCGWSIDAGNPQQIANAIRECAQINRAELDRLGENGYRFVMENHTYAHLAKRLISFIEE